LAVFLLIEVRVVGEFGGDEDPALLPPLHEEALIDPFVPRAAGVGCAPHSDRTHGALEAPEPREEVGVLGLRALRELGKADELELRALMAELVFLGLEVAEGERRPAGEGPRLVAFVPLRIGPSKPRLGAIHEGAR